MSRRRAAVKREVLPDPIYNDTTVTKFICSNYLETISNDDIDQKLQISNAAIKTIMGTVENEVLMVPKVNKKYGFFERIFKLFQK